MSRAPPLESSRPPVSRRRMLQRAGAGFGQLALAGLLAERGGVHAAATVGGLSPLHLVPRARRVIFLFMNGGPSHVDTFDPKPALAKYEGQAPKEVHKRGNASGLLPSPFCFARHGTGGVEMSELFPKLAEQADRLTVVRSMVGDSVNHEPGLLLMHSGSQQPIRPSIGSWATYGLGTENQNLPGFVVLCPGRPVVGPYLWSNSFLPGEYQGLSLDTNSLEVDKLLRNLKHPSLDRAAQARQVELVRALDRHRLASRPGERAFESQVKALELAFAMQSEAKEAFDVSRESEATRDAYGRSAYGQSCLLARRLVERGVRFVEVFYVNKNKQPWDTHQDNAGGHRRLCADSDRGTAALLEDLAQRGLLEDTLVVWSGEFGRTPYAQKTGKGKAPGRDHHHTGFTTLLAGGGVKGGYTHGATDEIGMHSVTDRVHVHDLHATILHLLGIDHERLTYRYSGRDFRLTDVHGDVVKGLIA